MYLQTEELMKFQFMSMSLSYFSSLNMLKTMRDINADTTTAAVTSSADAAAAAAASAAAANIPAIKAGKVMESVADVTSQEVRGTSFDRLTLFPPTSPPPPSGLSVVKLTQWLMWDSNTRRNVR